MEVLHRGKPWNEVTCYGCKSVLLASSSDIYVSCRDRDDDGDYITSYKVKCPVCGDGVSIRPPSSVMSHSHSYDPDYD